MRRRQRLAQMRAGGSKVCRAGGRHDRMNIMRQRVEHAPAITGARTHEATGSASDRDERPPTVLFIGGYSRSGSTLLDLLLGQLPGFFSSGELAYIWSHGL